jgi:hypothetical protein
MKRAGALVLAAAAICVAVVGGLSIGGRVRAADRAVVDPLTSAEVYGLPAKLSSLGDLGALDQRADLSGPNRVDVLVWWLAQERADPSPTTTGLGGGVIDSGYIQVQIAKMLRQVGDLRALTNLADSEAISAPGVRDGMICALGMMGDGSRIPRLLGILQTHQEGELRALAAEALGYLGALEATEALNAALTDEFTRQAGDLSRSRDPRYPVREAARTALRMLGDEQAMARAKRRREAFDEDMRARPPETREGGPSATEQPGSAEALDPEMQVVSEKLLAGIPELIRHYFIWPSSEEVTARSTSGDRAGLAKAASARWVSAVLRGKWIPSDLSERLVALSEDVHGHDAVRVRYEIEGYRVQVVQTCFGTAVALKPAATTGAIPTSVEDHQRLATDTIRLCLNEPDRVIACARPPFASGPGVTCCGPSPSKIPGGSDLWYAQVTRWTDGESVALMCPKAGGGPPQSPVTPDWF